MAQDEKTIYVYENWRGEAPTLLGRLRCGFVRGQETFSFEYDPAWLSSAESSFSLDPDLALYRGRQYVPLNKQLFGLFSDSCPDRWGRLLMKRKEAIDARKEDRKPRKLTESDFLLGVYDESRMGALRFSLEEGGEFLSNDKAFATPPWVNLRTLENASIAFENDESGLNEKWLRELLAPGSAGDQFEGVEVVVDEVQHPPGLFVRHFGEVSYLLLHALLSKGLLYRPVAIRQLLGRLGDQSVKQRLFVRIIAVDSPGSYSQ